LRHRQWGLKLIAYAGNPVLPAIGWKCEPDPFNEESWEHSVTQLPSAAASAPNHLFHRTCRGKPRQSGEFKRYTSPLTPLCP
jgi:hypothetical protein